MREAEPMERDIELPDITVDPGVLTAVLQRRAFVDHAGEVAVDGDRESALPHGAGEAARQVKLMPRTLAPGKRDQGPNIGVVKPDVPAVGAFRHRKHAERVGLDERLGREGETVCHVLSPRRRWSDSVG